VYHHPSLLVIFTPVPSGVVLVNRRVALATALLAGGLQAPTLLAAQSAATAAASPQATGEAWRIVTPLQSSQVYARDGSLIAEVGREIRSSVALRTLPKYVYQAFVAVEDKRFYQHDGVDLVGVAGAVKDIVTGDPRGASTITQQLVGNMHPDLVDRRDKSLSRKLREQQAAREMEKRYTKEQILEAYLNQINYGHGWYGIDAAARHWFGKPAAQLTVAEAASLASMPKSPVYYDPRRFADRHVQRRNLVLGLMAEQKYISAAQAAQARRAPLVLAKDNGYSVPAPWVVDLVRQEAERAGVNLAAGGLRIQTTIDPALQRYAEEALRNGLAAVEKRPGYRHPVMGRDTVPTGRTSPYLQGAVVALDAATGEVRALVGGRDHARAPFNRATLALRQPGSAFKPFVYAAALADSMSAVSVVGDTAIDITLDNGRSYKPTNSDGTYLGLVTMREALARSRNPVAVQLAQEVGLDTVIAIAHRAGIATPIAPYPSSALGASAVRPLDFVAAYSAFGPTGQAVEPHVIVRVQDRAGRTVWTAPEPRRSPALSPEVAFIVRDMMRDVVERGTATSVRKYLPATVPVAGKTGTTNDNADVWFVGMTPELVAGVWIGFDQPKMITAGAAGGTLAAPIWGEMLGRWYDRRTSVEWPVPAGLIAMQMDRETGRPADASTPAERSYVEHFLPGTEPGARLVDPMRLFAWGPLTF
jgi:1A family penicillin-binding protein